MQGRFKNETRRHMTTVEGVEVSFNSLEGHDESAKACLAMRLRLMLKLMRLDFGC
jgi:hypothetical protein